MVGCLCEGVDNYDMCGVLRVELRCFMEPEACGRRRREGLGTLLPEAGFNVQGMQLVDAR